MSGVRTAAARKFYEVEGVLPANQLPGSAPSEAVGPLESVTHGVVRPLVSPPSLEGSRVNSMHNCHILGEQITIGIVTQYKRGDHPSFLDPLGYAGMVILPMTSHGSFLHCGVIYHSVCDGIRTIHGIVFPTFHDGPVLIMCGCPEQYSDLRRLARSHAILDSRHISVHGTIRLPTSPGVIKYGNYNRGDLTAIALPMLYEDSRVCELTLGQTSVADKPQATIRLRLLSFTDNTWCPLEAVVSVAASPTKKDGCPLLPRNIQFYADNFIEYKAWCVRSQLDRRSSVNHGARSNPSGDITGIEG